MMMKSAQNMGNHTSSYDIEETVEVIHMHYSIVDGVIFIEGSHPQARPIKDIEVKIRGSFSQTHLESLNDVKKKMAIEVRKLKGNCVINFEHGQKSTFPITFMGMDTIMWFGRGTVAVLPENVACELIAEKGSYK